MMKLSDYVIRTVAGWGVKNIFLLPGGGCMHLVDSVGRCKKIHFVCNLHEQAAVIAADGYSQYTGKIGVSLVTTGPGGTNAITGVAGAWIDSTPVLVISGQVKRADLIGRSGLRQRGPQEVDIVSLVKPITKYAVTVTDPTTIRYHLEKAFYLAKNGRPGPVWLDVPLDVQAAKVNVAKLPGFKPPRNKKPALAGVVSRVSGLIGRAERPVFLAGRGIRLAGAEKPFVRLVEALNVPVLTTWRAADLMPENHPLFFGRPGSIAARYANFIQQNADLIVTLGARLDLLQVGYNYPHFGRGARKVVVELDRAEIRKIRTKLDVPVMADAGEFIRELYNRVKAIKLRDMSAWLDRCREWKARYPVVLGEYLKPAKTVNTYALIEALSGQMRADDVLVPGSSGSCAEITLQAFKVKMGQRVLNSPGLGAMGYGLPQSIGACLASGRKRTICLVGDGGLQHNIQELETLKRLQIPVKLFVLNNNGYASIRNTHRRFFEGRLVCCDPSSGLTLPATVKIASAYGLKTARISGQNDLAAGVRRVLNMPGPVVCEVMVDPDLQTAPRLSSAAGPDGRMVSRPMEDLWPFLDRDELEENLG